MSIDDETLATQSAPGTYLADIANGLQAIYLEIAELRSLLQPTGFLQVGPTIVVFCNLTGGESKGWYTLTQDGGAQTMPPIFQGRISWIRVIQTTRRNKSSYKFRLHMRGSYGQQFEFEAGISTFFTRSALSAISGASIDQLRQVIRIQSWVKEIEKGENQGDKTLAISLYDYLGNRMNTTWKADDNWNAVLREADQKVQAAVGKKRQGKIDSYD